MAASISTAYAGGGGPKKRHCHCQTSALYKWLLVICWLLALAQIWFAEVRVRVVEQNLTLTLTLPWGGGNGNVVYKSASNNNKTRSNHNHQFQVQEGLVEALQPITLQECCVSDALYTHHRQRNDPHCFGTCYNERACNNDPVYPFNSAEEKELFPKAHMSDFSNAGRMSLRRECTSPKELVPPVKWCQKPHNDDVDSERGNNGAEAAAHLVKGIPPAGCTLITSGGGSGAFQHVVIFPAAKLALCGIPKVGITQWEQFLRFYIGAKDYPALPHYKLDRNPFQFDKLDPRVQRRIWEDEEWTWAAFIRDPAERLLSAYLDKVGTKKHEKKHGFMSFESFIDTLSQQTNVTSCDCPEGVVCEGLSWCSDPHWRPQVYSCGLSERLDRFQFIGDLDNAADQTRELLDHVGLWESHGKHYINGGIKPDGKVMKRHMCTAHSHPFDHTVHVGFMQRHEVKDSPAVKTAYGHSRGTKDKVEEYFTPELRKKVQDELYADDYKLWKLVSANGKELSKGKDLASNLSSKCAK